MKESDIYEKEVIDPGDRVSKLAHTIGMQSLTNSPAISAVPLQPGNFRGLNGYRWKRHILEKMLQDATLCGETLWDSYLEVPQNDGAGGKPQFFTLRNSEQAWRKLGWEVLTMVNDDLAARLCLPVVFMNQIDFKSVTDENFPMAQAILEGFGEALKTSRVVNMTGETAIMKHSITSFCDLNLPHQLVMTWSASGVGLAHKKCYVDGSTIRPGMPIIGIVEKGYRCNGGTRFTDILLAKWGPRIEDILQSEEAMRFVSQLVIPSQSYAVSLCRIGGWNPDGSLRDPLVKIHGAAHITGGGIWKKLAELLPRGVGATLNSMPVPPYVLQEGQRLSEEVGKPLSDYAAHSTFHGGVGMLIVVEPGCENVMLLQLSADGHHAEVVGDTTLADPNPERLIEIHSQFKNGEVLFGPKAD